MQRSDAIVLCHHRNANREQQTKRGIHQCVEPGESTATDSLEEADVLEVSNGAREQPKSQRKRTPGEKPGWNS